MIIGTVMHRKNIETSQNTREEKQNTHAHAHRRAQTQLASRRNEKKINL
jgi:hypothetical protein